MATLTKSLILHTLFYKGGFVLALVKWNPFIGFSTLQERMNQIFDEAISRQKGCYGPSSGSWTPSVDIYVTEEKIYISAELPGVNIDDVEVEVNKDVLRLSGTRNFGKDLKEEDYLRMERNYGSFLRTFRLPAEANKKGIKAKYHNGVLNITLSKTKKTSPKHIKVESK